VTSARLTFRLRRITFQFHSLVVSFSDMQCRNVFYELVLTHLALKALREQKNAILKNSLGLAFNEFILLLYVCSLYI